MLSQPPPWSSDAAILSETYKTTSHPRLETPSVIRNNLCEKINQCSMKREDTSTNSLDRIDAASIKSKFRELNVKRKRANEVAKNKLESVQKRLLNLLLKLRKSKGYKKEGKAYEKFWLCTPNGHLMKMYSFRLKN